MAEIVNGAGINETHAKVQRSRSNFPLKQIVLDTHRFAEYHPHLVLDGITSDKHFIRSQHVARSMNLKAPLMQDIQMHKDYFMVPLRAILPFNADKIISNPPMGDDVPADAYTNVTGFIGKIKDVHDVIFTDLSGLDTSVAANRQTFVQYLLKDLVFLESVFSSGSLIASLGCDLSRNLRCSESVPQLFDDNNYYSIDSLFDSILLQFVTYFEGMVVYIDNNYYMVSNIKRKDIVDFNTNYEVISWRTFLQKIRDTADWSVYSLVSSTQIGYISDYLNVTFTFENIDDLDVDLASLWAYHLCCAAFYSDDKIDYIYSADLFRSYIQSIGYNSFSGLVFNYNGLSSPYDYLSAHFFDQFVSSFDITEISLFQYFLTLFGYKRSLRFKDYFTGSRTRPLAVGDTNIPVVSNNVSVVDVSRSIQVQKFLNAVQSTGRKFEEYLKGIFGVAPSPDHHNPLFLAHSSDSIFASEIENNNINPATAGVNDTQTTTSVFRGNGNQYEYSVEVDEPCIILGITSYDIERSYSGCIDRRFFIKDRYDMFLPQLQYVGDQPIYRAELTAQVNAPMNAFGYTYRDMQWKQLINRAHGGFCFNRLPGFAFMLDRFKNAANISPDFIRSYNSELDDFFVSLTSYSLGTYFHFMVVNTNSDNASRPMAVNPQILG